MIFYIGRFFFKIISWFLFPVTVEGIDHIPRRGAFIMASNHISNLDPFLIGSFCGRKPCFVAKESLFKNRILGAFLSQLGAFAIKRNFADFGALRETLKRLKKGAPVLIFPEGTRKGKPGEKKVLPGIGFIAQKSKLPVFPVFVIGSDGSLPIGRKFPKRHPVTIRFGPPLDISGEPDSYPDISQRIIEGVYALGA